MTWMLDRNRRWLWLTLLFALVIRLGLALGVQEIVARTPGRICLIEGDAEGYWKLAGTLAAGEEYSIYDPPRRLLRMPGFPALLALPRLFFGNNPLVARLVLAVVGTLACGLTWWLGRELAGEAAGLMAAIYTAISPTMALFSVLFLSETAFAAAMLASLIAAARLVRMGSTAGMSLTGASLRQGLFTGILIGLATYMRPTWLLVGPVLAGLLVIFGRAPLRQNLAVATSVCLGLALTLAPWTVRNAIVTGHAIPTTLWVGPSLYDGLNATANGDSDMRFFDTDQLLRTMSEYEMDREYRRRAWEFAAGHPRQVAWLALTKQLRYWSPAPNADQFKDARIQAVAWLAFIPLLLFALIGIWLSRRDPWLLILTVAPVTYFALLHLLFVGSLRYRLPAEYPLAVVAAIGLTRSTSLREIP